jgi:hypothetical protein
VTTDSAENMAGKNLGVVAHMKAEMGGLKCISIRATSLNRAPVRMTQ